MGITGDCTAGFISGEAILELKRNGDNRNLIIVAGFSADDTRRAAIVLKNVATGKNYFILTGISKIVKGISLEISGITIE